MNTIRELFSYVDWARERLLTALASSDNGALDHPFEMGEGTLRKTLHHLWGAEQVWLSRWNGVPSPLDSVDAEEADAIGIAELSERFQASAAERNAWLAAQESLDRIFRYPRPFWMEAGHDLEINLGVTVLHLANHFPHHGAQAVNMMRRVGLEPPAIDYIVMRAKNKEAAPDLDAATLRRYLAHGDWAWKTVYDAASTLSEADRGRTFDIGPGSLRRVLGHLADAPGWWVDNLENGPGAPFPAIDENEPWDALWPRYQHAAQRRNRALDEIGDLRQGIRLVARPGVEREFPFGVVMTQLCVHGTYHRAQALNMLRHAGAEVPSLDVNVWHRLGVGV